MKPKFMVVDDDPETLNLIGSILEVLGCDVEKYERGETALEALQQPDKAQEIDALFLDIMLPGISGLDVLEQLRKMGHTASLPIILLTSKGTDEDVGDGYALGASYYIPKPFTHDQIVYGLDLLLNGDATEDGESEAYPRKCHQLTYNPDKTNPDRPSGIPLKIGSDKGGQS